MSLFLTSKYLGIVPIGIFSIFLVYSIELEFLASINFFLRERDLPISILSLKKSDPLERPRIGFPYGIRGF